MNRRSIAITAAICAFASVAGIFSFDNPIARVVHQGGGEHSRFLAAGTSILEVASGMTLTKFALGFALLVVGLAMFAWKGKARVAWVFLFLACTHLSARLITGVLKEVFHRIRPFEALANNAWDHQFFAPHGGSFPSGHATHFWALFFPLAFLFPSLRVPFLILPTFIALARIGVNDHWASDVLASIALAAAITLFFIWIFGKKLGAARNPVH